MRSDSQRRLDRTAGATTAQRGVALVISLLLLAVSTVSGIALLSGTRINERIASNVDQKNLAFEASESAISAAWIASIVLPVLQSTVSSSVDSDHEPVLLQAQSADLSEKLDQTTRSGKSMDLSVEASIQYCGETSTPIGSSLSAIESDMQLVGVRFNAGGQAVIAGSSAKAIHLQHGYIVRPASGRQGSCTAVN